MPEDIVGFLHPRRKRFETWEVRRPPVDITPFARAWIVSASSQGRLFPQALSEVFGRCDDLEDLHLDVVPLHYHFQDEQEGEYLCVVEVQRSGERTQLLISASALRETHANGHPAFLALEAAEELLRVDQMRRDALSRKDANGQ